MTFLKLVQDDLGKFMSMRKDQPFMSVLRIQCGSCQQYFLFGHLCYMADDFLFGGSFLFWNLITSCSL